MSSADLLAASLRILLLSAPPLVGCLSVGAAPTRWPVDIKVEGVKHTVQVPENTPVLAVVESAGLMPSSDCRRGNCLSCVAVRRARPCGDPHLRFRDQPQSRPCTTGAPRLPSQEVLEGAPFSLRVSEHTALCKLVKDANMVPLCSTFVTGPGVALELDGAAGRAWDLQYCSRFRDPHPPPTPTGPSLSDWAVFCTTNSKGEREKR